LRQQRVVALRKHVAQHGLKRLVADIRRKRLGRLAAGSRGIRHHQRPHLELRRQVAKHPVEIGAEAVDLVDEDEEGHGKPPQRAHEDARLGLHAFHGRDDHDRPIQQLEDALHFRDEIRVAGRIDQVDGHAVQGERHDGGPDRDAALAFEGQAVRLGAAAIDAPQFADHA
jgi:hypothetical protein